MYVVRLLPYYFGTVYRPTFNLQVLLNGLSRKLQPVFMYGLYLNYRARVSRKGFLNQHSQRPTLYWLQKESLKTCTYDICWSDLCFIPFRVWLVVRTFLIPFRFCTTTSLFKKGLVRLLFSCSISDTTLYNMLYWKNVVVTCSIFWHTICWFRYVGSDMLVVMVSCATIWDSIFFLHCNKVIEQALWLLSCF